jgi:hypothetical protein
MQRLEGAIVDAAGKVPQHLPLLLAQFLLEPVLWSASLHHV